MLVARGAGQAVRACEGVVPDAAASAAADVDGVLAIGAGVAALAVGDAIAVEEAAPRAGNLGDGVQIVVGDLLGGTQQGVVRVVVAIGAAGAVAA